MLTEDQKLQIISDVESITTGDDKDRWVACEVLASFIIINKYLGSHFYDRETNPSLAEKAPGKHPLAVYSSSGQPIDMLRLIAFAHYVERTHDLPFFNSKRKELSGRRFDSVFFELKIASTFRDMGGNVSFISPSKQRKTCEFQLNDQLNVECKRRPTNNLEFSSLESSFCNFLESTIEKTGPDEISMLCVEIPATKKPNPFECRLIDRSFHTALLTMMDAYPDFNDKVAAVQLIVEYKIENVQDEWLALPTDRLLSWRGIDYHNLDTKILQILEEKSTPTEKDYPWVDYKSLSGDILNRNFPM